MSSREGVPLHVKRDQDAARRAQALELRLAGATFASIAERLGYSDAAAAYRSVRYALERAEREPAQVLLVRELETLDRMQVRLWPAVRLGETKAVDAVLRIMERRAKYLGLDSAEARMAAAAEVQASAAALQVSVLQNAMLAILQRLDLTDEQWAKAPEVVVEELDKINHHLHQEAARPDDGDVVDAEVVEEE